MSSNQAAPKGLALAVRNQNVVSRLSRQQGKSNLREPSPKKDAKDTDKSVGLTQSGAVRPRAVAIRRPSTVPPPQQSFQVYQDEVEEENNVIHQLEKRCKEIEKTVPAKKSPAKVARKPLAVIAERTSSFSISGSTESDEDDVFSVVSHAPSGTTIIRSELSNMGMDELDKDSQSTYMSALDYVVDEKSEYMTAITEKENSFDIVDKNEFFQDAYHYMRNREIRVRPKPSFMLKQVDISEDMRYILVDWLSDVVQEYSMQSETFHLACSILDRTLSRFRVERQRLQLVGATAMMIASKFEEIYPPTVKDFVYLTDDTFTAKQFLGMERAMLSELDFEVSAPTAHWFGSRFARMQAADRRTRQTMNYLLDLSLLSTGFATFKPSYIAAASLCYANILTGPVPWSSAMEASTEIKAASLSNILHELHRLFTSIADREQHSVYTRYSESEMLSVALIEPPTVLPF